MYRNVSTCDGLACMWVHKKIQGLMVEAWCGSCLHDSERPAAFRQKHTAHGVTAHCCQCLLPDALKRQSIAGIETCPVPTPGSCILVCPHTTARRPCRYCDAAANSCAPNS